MNKFLKGAVVCGALIPCVTGLVACGDKPEKPAGFTGEDAYNMIFAEVNGAMTKMSEITTPGKEFQLNVNASLDVKTVVQGIASGEGAFSAKLRAVIGARNNNNKELFGTIGMVDGQNNFKSILSAYAVSDVDDNAEIDEDIKYTDVDAVVAGDILKDEANWAYYDGILYTYDAVNEEYVLVDGEYDAEATYYMLTQDLLHLYLASSPSVLKEYTLLTEQPADWETNYTNYYRQYEHYAQKLSTDVYEAGKYYKEVVGQGFQLVQDVTEPADWATAVYYVRDGYSYQEVTDETAPEWQANTYYAQTGIDLNQILYGLSGGKFTLPEGEIYVTLNMGDQLPEIPEQTEPETPNVGEGEGEGEQTMPSIDDIMAMIQDSKDMTYTEFLQSMNASEGVTVTGEKASNGDVSMKMVGEGRTMVFTAKAAGGISISIEKSDEIREGVSQVVSVTIDIDLEDEIDESYLPENLEIYGECEGDLVELIGQLMGGTEE